MNKEKINAGIDRMAEEAKETMNLRSDKIDRATRCGNEKAARIKRSAKAGLRRTTDADRERDCAPELSVSYGLDGDDNDRMADYRAVRGLNEP